MMKVHSPLHNRLMQINKQTVCQKKEKEIILSQIIKGLLLNGPAVCQILINRVLQI